MTKADNQDTPPDASLALVPLQYDLSGDDMRAAFAKQSMYPVELASASISDAVVDLYTQTLDWLGVEFDPDEAPWVPVGRVGPLLVLGHCQPALTPPPVPTACFQPVLLRKEDYERQLKLCTPLIETAERPIWDGEILASPRTSFPDRPVLPTTPRAALQFLIEYYPHQPNDLKQIIGVMAGRQEPDLFALPAGYHGAIWLLMQRGAVVDLTAVRVPEPTVKRVPAELLGRVRPVSEYGTNLWIGMEHLPARDVEDLLLNELGEGWNVHFLLIDGPRSLAERSGSSLYAPPRSRDEIDTKTASRRAKRTIEDTRRARHGTGASPMIEKGVIRLSHAEIRELEGYNEKRQDREPRKVFLKHLSAAIRCGASDLHVEPGLDKTRIRARIDGVLEEWLEMPVEFGLVLVGAAKEILGLPAEKFRPQDDACTVHHGSEIVNLRLSTIPIRKNGQKIAIRLLPRRGEVPGLDVIMPEREAQIMRRAITRPFGLILICGPTGSGKTTTTFSALDEINDPQKNLTTLEDPIEYQMEGLNQAEHDPKREVSWKELLGAFLRQDPDGGFVGEIRDKETAETALRLTATGHVVFATLHTMSCANTVWRLIDIGVSVREIARALTLVVSQRLVRRVCQACREEVRLSAAEHGLFARHFPDYDLTVPTRIYRPHDGGCEHCRGTGYKGQIAAVEMLPVVGEVVEMIENERSAREIAAWMRQKKFKTVYIAALELVARGETTMEEANEWQDVWEELKI
jgi:type II secretory ATPase GspE/PulE/Tfp pilus assembly ATPase PilB-like protein